MLFAETPLPHVPQIHQVSRFDRSFANVSFIAGMLVDKYLYHLPLYRQHQRLEATGITITVAP